SVGPRRCAGCLNLAPRNYAKSRCGCKNLSPKSLSRGRPKPLKCSLRRGVGSMPKTPEEIADELLAQAGMTGDDSEIARLAALEPLPYARARKGAAKRLRIDVKTLDREVRAGRNRSTSGQGRSLELPEPEPWPESVNGALLLSTVSTVVRSYVVMSEPQADTVAL